MIIDIEIEETTVAPPQEQALRLVQDVELLHVGGGANGCHF